MIHFPPSMTAISSCDISSFPVFYPEIGGWFTVPYSVVFSALLDIMSRSRYSVVRGIILLPTDFPTVKGFVYLCTRSDFHVVQMLHIVLNVKGIFLVIIGQLLVPAMLRYIEFIREEWSDASKELPENNLRILFRVNLIKSVNFATGLRRLFGGIS